MIKYIILINVAKKPKIIFTNWRRLCIQ